MTTTRKPTMVERVAAQLVAADMAYRGSAAVAKAEFDTAIRDAEEAAADFGRTVHDYPTGAPEIDLAGARFQAARARRDMARASLSLEHEAEQKQRAVVEWRAWQTEVDTITQGNPYTPFTPENEAWARGHREGVPDHDVLLADGLALRTQVAAALPAGLDAIRLDTPGEDFVAVLIADAQDIATVVRMDEHHIQVEGIEEQPVEVATVEEAVAYALAAR